MLNWIKTTGRSLLGTALTIAGVVVALFALTGTVKADDISDTISDISGYVTAATAVAIGIVLFVLGRKVVRRLIAFALIAGLALYAQYASAATDITGTITTISGYVTSATAVAIGVVLFVLGRKVVRRLI